MNPNNDTALNPNNDTAISLANDNTVINPKMNADLNQINDTHTNESENSQNLIDESLSSIGQFVRGSSRSQPKIFLDHDSPLICE